MFGSNIFKMFEYISQRGFSVPTKTPSEFAQEQFHFFGHCASYFLHSTTRLSCIHNFQFLLMQNRKNHQFNIGTQQSLPASIFQPTRLDFQYNQSVSISKRRDKYPLDCKGSNISQYHLANVEVASSQYVLHHQALGTAEKDFQMILYLQRILF